MPRSKTTEPKKSLTGSRKLSKKGNKKGKIPKNKENNTTTEEMLDILSEASAYTGKAQQQMPMQQMPMQQMQMQQSIPDNEVDPLMVQQYVSANSQEINKIGDLLGIAAQLNNNKQIGNQVSLDSTIQNTANPFQNNQMAQQLTNQLMGAQPMGMGMQQAMGMQQPVELNKQMISNLSQLYSKQKLA